MAQLPKNSIIGTLGPKFSFHDIVRMENLKNYKHVYLEDFKAIFNALQTETIQAALIAVKNSIHGNVSTNSKIISTSELVVLSTFELHISLHLAIKTSISLDQVKNIYAHPVAWNECQQFLHKLDVNHIPSTSNSQALKDLMSDDNINTAAISGDEAIHHYGLQIIDENIQDKEPNITTFLLVTKKNNSE